MLLFSSQSLSTSQYNQFCKADGDGDKTLGTEPALESRYPPSGITHFNKVTLSLQQSPLGTNSHRSSGCTQPWVLAEAGLVSPILLQCHHSPAHDYGLGLGNTQSGISSPFSLGAVLNDIRNVIAVP